MAFRNSVPTVSFQRGGDCVHNLQPLCREDHPLRNKAGKVVEILFAGYKLLTESALTAEMRARYLLVGSEQEKRASARKGRREVS